LADLANSELEAAVIRKLTWRLVPFLFLLYIVAYLDRINVGFAALQMQQELHFDDAVYGFGAGVFFAGYFLFQVPSNLALQRFGAKRWIALLMITWGVISACMALTHTPRSFYVLRFLLGSAEAGFFPGVILYLKTWFPAAARARTVARFMTASPLSGVVGGPISGLLLNMHGTTGLSGWQWLFLLEGIPAVLLGGVVLLYLTNRPEDATWLSGKQREWLLGTLRNEAEQVATTASAFSTFSSGRVWMLCFVYFGLNTVSYGISMWLPNLIRSASGGSNLFIGVLSAVPYVAAAIAMVVVGLHSDKTGERRWHLAIPAFVGAIGLFAAAQSSSTLFLIVAISIGSVGVQSMVGPFWAIPTTLLAGSAAAVGIALINSVGNLGGFFGPYIIGFVRRETGGFAGGLLMVGGTLAVAGFVALGINLTRSARRIA
jgi:ACS family tartrate transporter-like MFS transporter